MEEMENQPTFLCMQNKLEGIHFTYDCVVQIYIKSPVETIP